MSKTKKTNGGDKKEEEPDNEEQETRTIINAASNRPQQKNAERPDRKIKDRKNTSKHSDAGK